MKRVTGIGGIFFKSEDPEKLYRWYQKHLGIESAADGSGASFPWRDADGKQKNGRTVWAIFPSQTKYFDPSGLELHDQLPSREFGCLARGAAEGRSRGRSTPRRLRLRPIRLVWRADVQMTYESARTFHDGSLK